MNTEAVKFLFAGLLCIFSMYAFAQKEERRYNERAAEVEEEVYNSEPVEFKVKDVPGKYRNESAVIIARSYKYSSSSRIRFKMTTFLGGAVRRSNYYSTYRERVILQDKAALEKYSSIEYTKMAKNYERIGLSSLKNSMQTYFGGKIVKPTGDSVLINPRDEEVFTENNSNTKEGRIAIPGLEVGDILDYYLSVEETLENTDRNNDLDFFYVRGEYPILYYELKYELRKNQGADCISGNGAGQFKHYKNKDHELVLEAVERDLPKLTNNFWVSSSRQIPYYLIRYNGKTKAEEGKVDFGPFAGYCKNLQNERAVWTRVDFSVQKKLENYFGGKKNLKNTAADSIINFLYNYYRWIEYGSFRDMKATPSRNHEKMNSFNVAISMYWALKTNKIVSEIILLAPRNQRYLDQVFLMGDFDFLLKIYVNNETKIIGVNDFFNPLGQLSADHEGEPYIVLREETKKDKGKEPVIEGRTLVSGYSSNAIHETISVKFNSELSDPITIDRNSLQNGLGKLSGQKRLLLAEEVEGALVRFVKEETDVVALAKIKERSELAKDIQALLDKERPNQKNYFKEEIKDQYGQEAAELISFKILNDGLSVQKPAFEYNEVFTMENFVKKAGNNYIFSIGQLIGEHKKVDDRERTRTLDVYMPYARTLSYKISVEIPEGYKAKGVEELNRNVKNEAASFSSVASVNGNTINLEVTRIYYHNFEAAASWPKLLEAMDAAAEFTSAKILLEKVK